MTSEEKIQALRYTLVSDGWKEVIKPALDLTISNLESNWLNGSRPKGQEQMTDDAIKGRIWSLVWMRSWEQRLDNLVKMLEAEQQAGQESADTGEGGSPY